MSHSTILKFSKYKQETLLLINCTYMFVKYVLINNAIIMHGHLPWSRVVQKVVQMYLFERCFLDDHKWPSKTALSAGNIYCNCFCCLIHCGCASLGCLDWSFKRPSENQTVFWTTSKYVPILTIVRSLTSLSPIKRNFFLRKATTTEPQRGLEDASLVRNKQGANKCSSSPSNWSKYQIRMMEN